MAPTFSPSAKLSQLLSQDHVFLDIPAHTREEVLVYVAEHLEQAGVVKQSQDLVDLLVDRERLGATVVGDEAAIPHCKVPGLKEVVVAFARLREAIPFGLGEECARLIFFVLSPREQPAAHLEVLANIARLLRSPQAHNVFAEARTSGELTSLLAKFEPVP
jgi:PTS system nitrogen regulatory IIA component